MAMAFCPNCGKARTGELRFCGSCGFEFGGSPGPEPAATHTEDPESVRCPLGGHPEMVQKVTAVFTSGSSYGQGVGHVDTSATTYSSRGGFGWSAGGGTTSMYEERFSGLATLLAPPEEPAYQSPWGLASRLWVGFWALGFVVLPSAVSNSPMGPGALIVDIPFLLLCTGGVWWWKARTAARRKRSVSAARARWKTLITEWDRSFYCHKDGVVFIPGEPSTIPAPDFPGRMALPAVL